MAKNSKKEIASKVQALPSHVILVLLLLIVTSFVYRQSLNNKITTWDDEGYLVENPVVKSLHGDSVTYTLKKVFTSYEIGNYHPLTMLSYCLEYNAFKLNPKPYHFTNLLLHLLNTLLVYGFIWLLTRQKWVAFITALLFSIHPMHVESVAWIAERKDVLYTLFYFAGLCTYLLYLQKEEQQKRYFYVLTIVLFILSAMSKAMAVSFPLVLFALDYYKGRKITQKTIFEKLPFIIISVVFGLIAIYAQKTAGAMNGAVGFGIIDRLLFTCYGVMMYIWKMIIPINLTCFYNYPAKTDGFYPIIFYIAPIVIGVLAFLVYKYKSNKDIVFGTAFFLITIALVLQLLPVGGTIISERYTYIPYIGLFFIVARILNKYIESNSENLQSFRTTVIAIVSLVVITFSYLSFQRIKVWHDDITLYGDAINKFDPLEKNRTVDKTPSNSNYALMGNIYYNRARTYFKLHNFNGAVDDFSASIYYIPTYFEAYNNRGNTFGSMGKFDLAIEDYSTAITLNPTYAEAFNNRAGTYYNLGKYELALNDLLMAQKLNYIIDPRFAEALQAILKNKQ